MHAVEIADYWNLRLSHDEKLTDLRLEYEDKFRALMAIHNGGLSEIIARFEAQEAVATTRIEGVSRGAIDTAILENSNRIAAMQAEGTAAVSASTAKLSRLRSQRSQLKKLVAGQQVCLDHLRRKVRENEAPIVALEATITRLESETHRFQSETAPALAALKCEVKQLQSAIKDRSLLLECLLQRADLVKEDQRDKSGLKEAIESVFSRLSACDAETVCSESLYLSHRCSSLYFTHSAMSKKRAAPSGDEEGMAGRDAMGRRVWDKDFFKTKYDAASVSSKKLVTGEPEALTSRRTEAGIDEKVSERKLVTNFTAKAHQGGFYCETCDCVLKDSRAYLDHINGRSHNRLLGRSMTVEKVPVERIIAKMERIKAGLEW